MSKIGMFLANGCEEVEALAVVDILRRAGVEIDTISITDVAQVTSSRRITFMTDMVKSSVTFSKYDGIILPGGMPGTLNLQADETVQKVIREFAAEGKMVAAICAAPSVLGQAGLLEGKKATCHPGFEDKLKGAKWLEQDVVVDGNMITSRGMGTAVPFGLAIVAYLKDDAAAEEVAAGLVYKYQPLG